VCFVNISEVRVFCIRYYFKYLGLCLVFLRSRPCKHTHKKKIPIHDVRRYIYILFVTRNIYNWKHKHIVKCDIPIHLQWVNRFSDLLVAEQNRTEQPVHGTQPENYTLIDIIKYRQSDEKDEVCKLLYIVIIHSSKLLVFSSKNIKTSVIRKKNPVLTGISNG